MQNKQYTVQFFSLPDDQSCSPSPSSYCRTRGFCRTRGVPAAWPTPLYKLSMVSMVWNISTGRAWLSAWLCSLPAPAHLLISQTRETEKSSIS